MVLYGFTDIYKKTGREKKNNFADNKILKAIEPHPIAARPRIRRRQERLAPEIDDLFQQGLHPSGARLPWSAASAISMRENNEEEEKVGKGEVPIEEERERERERGRRRLLPCWEARARRKRRRRWQGKRAALRGRIKREWALGIILPLRFGENKKGQCFILCFLLKSCPYQL